MKKHLTIIRNLLLLLGCLISASCYSQLLDLEINFPNRWGRLNPAPGFNATSLGIGTFTTPNDPDAALHVNTNGLVNTWYGAGEVFRTNSASTFTNAWRLFTGAGNGTEKFALYTLPNSNEINIQATEQDGELIFRTAGNQERMRITSDNGAVIIQNLKSKGNTFITSDSSGILQVKNIDLFLAQSNYISELENKIDELEKQLTVLNQKFEEMFIANNE